MRVTISVVSSYEVIKNIKLQYQNHISAENKTILINDDSESISIKTDITLLMRVLGNMLKNALEASKKGEIITLGCFNQDGRVEFYVKNQAFMPRDVQLQVFQRTFSTKSANRGFGTYSIKLLTERYLKGMAAFETSESSGTKFFIRLPLSIE